MAGILFLNAMLLVYTAVIVPVQVPFLKRSYFRVTDPILELLVSKM